METTYTIMGQDGAKYGPVGINVLRQWIAEGRLTPGTQVMRGDSAAWLPASQYPELGLAVSTPPPLSASRPPIAGTVTPQSFSPAMALAKIGSSWFYTIGALSALNSILISSNAGILFLGLGVTLLIPNFLFGLVVSAVFVALGYFGGKGHLWAFIVGMIIYAADACVFVLANLGDQIG